MEVELINFHYILEFDDILLGYTYIVANNTTKNTTIYLALIQQNVG
jgi:hypothetical protein